MTRPLRKAIFPMGGLGTRFLPATKAVPKELLPVVDKPLVQYAVEEAAAAGVETFIFVLSPEKMIIADHFRANKALETALAEKNKSAELEMLRHIPDGEEVVIAHQEEALGLGHAVWCARDHIGDEAFAVLLPDDMVLASPGCLAQMAAVYREEGGNLVAVENVPREQTGRYGILEVVEEKGPLARVSGLVEKPAPEAAPSTLAVIGRYILQPEIFTHLEAHETGAGGEIQLTDAMAKLLGVMPFHGYRFQGTRFDCGNKLGMLEANIAYGLVRPDLASDLRTLLSRLMDGWE